MCLSRGGRSPTVAGSGRNYQSRVIEEEEEEEARRKNWMKRIISCRSRAEMSSHVTWGELYNETWGRSWGSQGITSDKERGRERRERVKDGGGKRFGL